jgi:hypothetical protein
MKLFWQIWFVLGILFNLSACNNTALPTPTGAPIAEASNAKSASIGARGGSVSATASTGVTYTLIVPPNALKDTVSITLTPISSMGSTPLSAGVTAAVQMEPSGLSFKRSATLQIGAASSTAAGKRLFGFGSANDGSKFRLNSPTVKAGLTEMSINHFSDAGVGNATDAEIAGIPPIEPLAELTSDDFNDLVNYKASVHDTDQEIATEFKTWFTKIVKPLLLDAENSSDLNKVIDAEFAFEKWFDARLNIAASSEGKIKVEPFLTDEDAVARPIVAKLLVFELNQRIESCKTVPVIADKLADIYLISLLQNLVLKFQMDTAAVNLDAASVSSKINDCVRVVIDPIKPFTQVVVGSDKSLDARAQLVFAGTPDPVVAGFEFKVSSNQATVKQASGFSSSDGRYTTVFTPSNKIFILFVQACLVLPGEIEASSVCASQEARSVVSDGIFRGTIRLNAQYELTNNTKQPNLTSTISEKTDVTLDATVEFSPSNASSNRIITKNAIYGFVEARDRTEKITISTDCIQSVRIKKDATSSGTSSQVDSNDKVVFSVSGDTYAFELQKIFGLSIYKGTDATSVGVIQGTCTVDPGGSVSFQNPPILGNYLPNFFEKPKGTGTIITNPDGSRTIAGSITVNGFDPAGVSLKRNYTLTWNLTAF